MSLVNMNQLSSINTYLGNKFPLATWHDKQLKNVFILRPKNVVKGAVLCSFIGSLGVLTGTFAYADTIPQHPTSVNQTVQKNNLVADNLEEDNLLADNLEEDNLEEDNLVADSLVKQTPSITEIAEGLKSTYQNYPYSALQNITDPTSGVVIEDTYPVSVPEKITLHHAQQVLLQVSPKLASNKAGITANQLQSEATQKLDKPWVFLRAGATHYKLNTEVDLTTLKSGLADSLQQGLIDTTTGLPLPIDPNIISSIPPLIDSRIPDHYELEREDTQVNAGVAVLWPIYTAGRTDAITSFADARTQESQADALIDNDDLQKTLIERYFNAQLAIIVSYLREDALNTVEETDYVAQRLLEEGFISRVERLEAKVALSEAESESIKARRKAQLAMTALQRLLRTPNPVKPVTPIFISSEPLPPLEHFQQIALQNHPGLKKAEAKYAQAQSLGRLSNVENKPTVSLFGYHEIDSNPSWIAGVSASWKLWGGPDSNKQHAASQAQMRQALLAKVDASDNILLLVEKNWQEVENARVHFFSLNSNVQLAEELLHYKQLGMQEGVNTALDVMTAQTKYLQARTEQVAAANDYVQALAALTQSCGIPEAFNEYMALADIKLPVLY